MGLGFRVWASCIYISRRFGRSISTLARAESQCLGLLWFQIQDFGV